MQLTEQQKFIRDELSHKSKLVRIDKIIKELGVTDVPDFISDLNALEKAGEIILSKKNNIQSVRGAGMVKAKIISMSRSFCFAKPEDGGEDVYISIFYDKIVTATTQANGWIRKNIYWRDGTREEMYER